MPASYTYATDVPASIPVSKSKFFIGTKATDADNDEYIEVGGVMSIPDFGPTDQDITIDTVGYGLVLTEKGSTNPGGGQLDCVFIVGDAGQAALIDAQEDKDGNYNFRIEFPNKPSPGGRGTMKTIKGKVMAAPIGAGGPNNPYMLRVALRYNSLPTTIAAAST